MLTAFLWSSAVVAASGLFCAMWCVLMYVGHRRAEKRARFARALRRARATERRIVNHMEHSRIAIRFVVADDEAARERLIGCTHVVPRGY